MSKTQQMTLKGTIQFKPTIHNDLCLTWAVAQNHK